jgi:alpha-glucosidase (family GH31 glycosyl hydrolase)
VQRNTEAAVPYFVSSRGYGILWDNTAKSWLNWPEEEVALERRRMEISPTPPAIATSSGTTDPGQEVGEPSLFETAGGVNDEAEEEVGEGVELHYTSSSLFEAYASGRHYFTVHCDDVDYSASVAAVAQLDIRRASNSTPSDADSDDDDRDDGAKQHKKKQVVIDWNEQRNKPPSLTGFVDLLEGEQYDLRLRAKDCCVPFGKSHHVGDFRLLVTRPPRPPVPPSAVVPAFSASFLDDNATATAATELGSTALTTLRSALGSFVDYYVTIAPSSSSSPPPSSSSSSSSAAGNTTTTTFDSLVAHYRTLTGPAPLLGKWAYGFWQCKEHYHNRTELVGAAAEFRSRGLPIDNIVQDWKYWGHYGWMSGARCGTSRSIPTPLGWWRSFMR